MTSKSKNKNKESHLSQNDDNALNSSEDELGFQYFLYDLKVKSDSNKSYESEAKARFEWSNLRLNEKKSFIKSFKVDENVNNYRKSLKSHKLQRSPSPNIKRNRKHSMHNENVVLKAEKETVPLLFQMEIQRLVASPAQYSFQPVCCVCEIYTENNVVLQCTGICKRYFHWVCLKNLKEDHPALKSNFQCLECFSEIYRCILCQKIDNLHDLLACESSDCGRLYHRSCLEMSNFIGIEIKNNKIISCPSHYCISCVREDATFAQNPSKKLVECLRCPLSFHCNDLCMAAGAYELSLSHVICPQHFENKLVKLNAHKPFHPAWCFKCFKTGVKLHCNYCPASYHTECVDKYSLESRYICYNCRNFRQPRYGEVLFVKVSQYRWWPCEIIHPRNAPMNILKLNRPDGTYPVLFLGSNEYQWVAKTRSIDFNTAKFSSIFKEAVGTTRMDRDFTAGLKVAVKIHQVYVNILLMHVPLRSISAPTMTTEELYPYVNVKEINQKTVKFKLIKANIIVPPAKLPPKVHPSICDCGENCPKPDCKNYLNKIECQITQCPKCTNQQFTNVDHKTIAVFKTSNRGYGLKTTVPISKNDFIIEYLGELITKSESELRMQNAKKCNTKDFYMIQLTGDLIIDAAPKGNFSRYMNHSCDPNCYLENWIVNGYPKKGVFALKDIGSDQELTFDYRISGVIMKEDAFCLCSSNNCTGFLGPIKSLPNSPIKSQLTSRNSSLSLASAINEKSFIEIAKDDLSKQDDKIAKIIANTHILNESFESFKDIPLSSPEDNCLKDKDSVESKTIHENFCYRCFDGGNLVLCDKLNCPKTYHLSCLGLEEAPPGTWYCPWHFCDICGKQSELFCVRCPASFCDAHAHETNIVVPTVKTRKSICLLHKVPLENQTSYLQNEASY